MKSDHSLETFHRIYDDREGVCLQVGPDTDGLDLVQLGTPNKESVEHYGEVRLVMLPEQARLVAKALILAADAADAARETHALGS